MLALAFFKWWYGPGWAQGWHELKSHLRRTYYGFSVPQLLRTLFAPWRRIVTLGGGALGDRLRALIDNSVSRVIGAIVRMLALLLAAFIMIGWLMVTAVRLIVWPFLPLAGAGLIIWGLR